MKKRVLTIVVALCLVISLFPAAEAAADEPAEEAEPDLCICEAAEEGHGEDCPAYVPTAENGESAEQAPDHQRSVFQDRVPPGGRFPPGGLFLPGCRFQPGGPVLSCSPVLPIRPVLLARTAASAEEQDDRDQDQCSDRESEKAKQEWTNVIHPHLLKNHG